MVLTRNRSDTKPPSEIRVSVKSIMLNTGAWTQVSTIVQRVGGSSYYESPNSSFIHPLQQPRPLWFSLAVKASLPKLGVQRQSFAFSFRKSLLTSLHLNREASKSHRNEMRIVGLTGGIASGKSTVSNLFKSNGIPVVDADLVARDVLKKDTLGYKKVVQAFGNEILIPETGEVDRPKLGRIVFADQDRRQLLNKLLAPYISRGILLEVLKLWLKGHKVIVLDVPLLFEAKLNKWTNPVVVVWVDRDTQLRRLKVRDGIVKDEEGENKINAQMSLDWKKSQADIVIDNTGSLEDLKEQFEKVLRVVTGPLTWKEFLVSRQGFFLVLVSGFAGIMGFKVLLKFY